MRDHLEKRGPGLALGLVSALLFSTSGAFGAALLDSGWSPAGAVLARILVAAAVLSPARRCWRCAAGGTSRACRGASW